MFGFIDCECDVINCIERFYNINHFNLTVLALNGRAYMHISLVRPFSHTKRTLYLIVSCVQCTRAIMFLINLLV